MASIRKQQNLPVLQRAHSSSESDKTNGVEAEYCSNENFVLVRFRAFCWLFSGGFNFVFDGVESYKSGGN